MNEKSRMHRRAIAWVLQSIINKNSQPRPARLGFLTHSLWICGSPYRCADDDVPACATNSIRVPLSSRTFLPAEVITDPSAEFAALPFKLNPFIPNTPRLVEVS